MSLLQNTKLKAFTLVELAIVLIIVGLITGGVVGAQSLINSANRQAVVKEFKDIELLLRAFKLEYDSLPGDMVDATSFFGTANCGAGGSQSCNGDGNNLLDGSNGIKEGIVAWQHLKISGIAPELNIDSGVEFDGNTPFYVIGEDLLRSSWNSNSGYLIYWQQPPWSQFTGNMIEFGVPTNNSLNRGGPVMNPKDAKNIDLKLDDGLPQQGLLRGDDGSFVTCVSSSAYAVSEIDNTCVLRYRLKAL